MSRRGTPWPPEVGHLQGDVTFPGGGQGARIRPLPWPAGPTASARCGFLSGPLSSGTGTAQLEAGVKVSLTWGPEPLSCSSRPAPPSSCPGGWVKGGRGQTEVPGSLCPGCASAPLQSQEVGPHGPSHLSPHSGHMSQGAPARPGPCGALPG